MTLVFTCMFCMTVHEHNVMFVCAMCNNRSDGFVVQAGDPEPEGDKVYYILLTTYHTK
jgi:hypothetical protein